MATKEERERAREEKAAQLPVDDHIRAAAHYGTTPEVMAGALYGVTDDLTQEEAAQKLKEFQNKPVGGHEEQAADE